MKTLSKIKNKLVLGSLAVTALASSASAQAFVFDPAVITTELADFSTNIGVGATIGISLALIVAGTLIIFKLLSRGTR